jgi:colicin import membrane protein
MTFQALPRHTALFLIGDVGEAGSRRLRKTVVVSLVLHLCLLSVIMGAKFFKKTERPLSAVEVSLVTLPPVDAKPEPKVEKAVPHPTPKPVQSAPMPVPPKTVQTPTPPPIPPPVQAAPVAKSAPPAPAPAPAPRLQAPVLAAPQPVPQAAKSPSSAPVTNRADVLRDVMKDIELPPNAPQYGDLAPMKPAEVKKSAQPKVGGPERSDLDAMLKKLNVPEMAAAQTAPPQEPPKPAVTPTKRASLSEEMNNDLDRELQDLKKLPSLPPVKATEPVREVKPMFREPQPVASAPPVTASVPRSKPETKLGGWNVWDRIRTWNIVQSRISKLSGPPRRSILRLLTVTVRFRLERDGSIGVGQSNRRLATPTMIWQHSELCRVRFRCHPFLPI